MRKTKQQANKKQKNSVEYSRKKMFKAMKPEIYNNRTVKKVNKNST